MNSRSSTAFLLLLCSFLFAPASYATTGHKATTVLSGEWGAVSASISDKGVALNWEYFIPGEVIAFEMHRCNRDMVFETIDTLFVGSSRAVKWFYEDDEVNKGMHYYKITALTNTGERKDSPLMSIHTEGAAESARMYPNPTTRILKITRSADSGGNLEVVDMLGRRVIGPDSAGIHYGVAEDRIDVSLLTDGQYIIRYENGFSRAFIKI